MLQIIGWLGCVMLAVKLLEMSANPALHGEDGKLRSPIPVALLLGWLSVIGFALWLYAQGQPAVDLSALPTTEEIAEQNACLDRAKTVEEITACTP
jgi:hypothetical protein